MEIKFKFSLFSRNFRYTNLFDKCQVYSFGCIRVTNSGKKDNQTYWHKVGFGLYIQKNHWFPGGEEALKRYR